MDQNEFTITVLSLLLLCIGGVFGIPSNVYLLYKSLRKPALWKHHPSYFMLAALSLLACGALVPAKCDEYWSRLASGRVNTTLCIPILSINSFLEVSAMSNLIVLSVSRSVRTQTLRKAQIVRNEAVLLTIAVGFGLATLSYILATSYGGAGNDNSELCTFGYRSSNMLSAFYIFRLIILIITCMVMLGSWASIVKFLYSSRVLPFQRESIAEPQWESMVDQSFQIKHIEDLSREETEMPNTADLSGNTTWRENERCQNDIPERQILGESGKASTTISPTLSIPHSESFNSTLAAQGQCSARSPTARPIIRKGSFLESKIILESETLGFQHPRYNSTVLSGSRRGKQDRRQSLGRSDKQSSFSSQHISDEEMYIPNTSELQKETTIERLVSPKTDMSTVKHSVALQEDITGKPQHTKAGDELPDPAEVLTSVDAGKATGEAIFPQEDVLKTLKHSEDRRDGCSSTTPPDNINDRTASIDGSTKYNVPETTSAPQVEELGLQEPVDNLCTRPLSGDRESKGKSDRKSTLSVRFSFVNDDNRESHDALSVSRNEHLHLPAPRRRYSVMSVLSIFDGCSTDSVSYGSQRHTKKAVRRPLLEIMIILFLLLPDAILKNIGLWNNNDLKLATLPLTESLSVVFFATLPFMFIFGNRKIMEAL